MGLPFSCVLVREEHDGMLCPDSFGNTHICADTKKHVELKLPVRVIFPSEYIALQ